MADIENPELEEVLISTSAPRYSEYSINKMLGQNFLKSSKFAIQIPLLPEIVNLDIAPEDLTFLCDSVEFPGQSLTTSEYRMPGKLKLKVPYVREMNEVTMTFYHNDKIPMYKLFSNWIENSSRTNTTNLYFDEIVCPKIKIFQFDEVSGVRGFFRDIFEAEMYRGSENKLTKYMTVELQSAFPLNFTSMPSNWADDGFHKMTVSFFYEDMITSLGIKNLSFKDLLNSGNIVDPPVRNQGGTRPATRIEDIYNRMNGPFYA
jgi:hypothetical protein